MPRGKTFLSSRVKEQSERIERSYQKDPMPSNKRSLHSLTAFDQSRRKGSIDENAAGLRSINQITLPSARRIGKITLLLLLSFCVIQKKILPFGVILFDEPLFFFSAPFLELFFPGNGFDYFCKPLHVNQFIYIVLFCESWIYLINVFFNPEQSFPSHSNIKHRMMPVGHDIYVVDMIFPSHTYMNQKP